MNRKLLLASGVVMMGTLWSACGHGPYYGYSYGYAPPPPRYAVVGVAPGPGYIWTNGYWDRDHDRWAWRDGRWAVPPRGRTTYVAPRWEQHGNSWVRHEGRWR
jgi:hypothetical protein